MAEVTEPGMLTDEQAAEIEEKYLKGELTEESGPEKVEEEAETEEEEEVVAEEEGPAIKEAKRLRQKNREISEEMEELRNQLNALSSKVTETEKEEKQTQIQKATTDQLLNAEIQLEQKLYEARQEGDADTIKQLTQVQREIKTELMTRPSQELSKKQTEDEAKAQWSAFEKAVIEAVPDITDKSSAIYKAAEKWASENKALMKMYGDTLGGVLATAQALIMSKSTTKSAKKAIKSVTEEMEKIAESSVPKSGSSGSQQGKSATDYKSMTDEQFEEEYRKMMAGEQVIP